VVHWHVDGHGARRVKLELDLMSYLLSSGLRALRGGSPLARASIAAVLVVPMLVVTLALTPPIMICSFLQERHQQHVRLVLESLRLWSQAIGEALGRDRP
jgi:hypothetical protein